MSMVRQEVRFTPAQARRLKAHAQRLGLSVSEVVRRATDRYLAQDPKTVEAIWEEQVAFMHERAAAHPGGTGKRTWTREDLYDRGRR